MKNIRSIVLLLTLLTALLLSACVAPGAAPAAESSGGAGSAATGGEKVKISWWQIWGGPEVAIADKFKEIADEYMAEHPNVEIEITVITGPSYDQKLSSNMQAGDPPDIFQTWGGGELFQYADAGLVQDVTDALAQDGWGDTFAAGPVAAYTHNGKIYGIPWRFGMVGIYYSKALFEQAGIEEIPTTWSDFLTVVQQLKDAGITPIALGEKDKWTGHFWWSYLAVRNAGAEGFANAVSRDGSFADEPFITAGEQLQQLIDLEPFQDGYMEQGYAEQQVLMGTEQAAMELMGQWAFGANTAVAGDNLDHYVENLDWFPFPMVDDGAGKATDAFGGGDGFAIGKNAPPETLDFIKFVTSKEHQEEMAAAEIAVLPVVKGAEVAIEQPVLRTVAEHFNQAEYLQLYLDRFLPPAVGLAVNDYVQELFAGTKNAEEVAVAIDEVAEAELSE